jgi:hypothetical protein
MWKYLALSLIASCYNPQIDRCTITCVGMGPCPDSMTCGGDGYCHASGDRLCSTGDSGQSVAITVVPGGMGTGTVTADFDQSFQCTSADAGTSSCELDVPPATTVTFTEAADSPSVFSGWSDAGASCSGATCQVTTSAPVNLGAQFDATAQLTLDLGGNGDGVVTSNPPNLANTAPVEPTCEDESQNSTGPCQGRFIVGTQITLTAVANNDNSSFGNWGESVQNMPQPCDANTNPCVFTITADIEFGVQFNNP